MRTHPSPKECEVVQPATPRGQTLTPLFLIHDGGGTTFAYHCLSSLEGRAVFGIANPRFHSGVPWEGGVPEMAATYLLMIRNTVTKGREYPALAPYSSHADGRPKRRRILLGGWSLGGLLSLEIARLLGEDDRDFEIVGLVMVDSVYPVWPEGSNLKIGRFVEDEKQETEPKNLRLAKRAMKMAGAMVRVWKMPRCGAASEASSLSVPKAAGYTDDDVHESATTTANGGDVEKDFYVSKEEKETAEIVWERPPRAVLVKAKQHVPMPVEGISSVDVYRGDEKLGWDGYCPGFVEGVLLTEGSHFDMFAWTNIDGITEKIAEACRILEGVQ
ncbi:thioesterase domain-containing protein [Colletotrichum orchidophilum]|uniref:Thioesterase domain-containing protein n=1 Tax=Colletotrichum orchidophilum TaxID=1209926 RepID=A0A1G4AUM7_9PEZI|nr:thioesterase domain-containing protein [Colletotrichum orchidophilum]OHE92811.1 thioesterase domain-containing protein [Colletotrichum orchidophilum]